MYVKSEWMMNRGFQSLTILQLDTATALEGEGVNGRRRKRALRPEVGVLVKAAVQFGSATVAASDYESVFEALTERGTRFPTGENVRRNATVVAGEYSSLKRVNSNGFY